MVRPAPNRANSKRRPKSHPPRPERSAEYYKPPRMLFAAVPGHPPGICPTCRRPMEAEMCIAVRHRRPDGRDVLTLSDAARRFGKSKQYLASLWACTFGDLYSPVAMIAARERDGVA
jgi:hypothetical protein